MGTQPMYYTSIYKLISFNILNTIYGYILSAVGNSTLEDFSEISANFKGLNFFLLF